MGLPAIQSVGGNLQDEELRQKISRLANLYIDLFVEKVRATTFSPAEFSFGKPTNYYFVIDRKFLHMIYSSDFAGAIAEVFYIDLRNQKPDSFSLEEVARFLRSQRGFQDWTGVNFSIELLDYDNDNLRKNLETVAADKVRDEYNKFIIKHQPLFIPEEQIRRFLGIATEDEFTQLLVVPLLRHLGFMTAEAKGHKDKSLEFGQDIQRMKIQLPTGHWLYFSAQVKRGDIKANTKQQKDNVENVLTQTYQQLNWEMFDPELGINVKPDHVLLIVSGDISEAAKQYIYRHELVSKRKVLLWEKEIIIRLLKEKGLPAQVQNIILEVNKKKL